MIRRHGMSNHKLYAVWRSMKARCLNKNDHAYPRYGGRGISVCERWMIFDNFILDMMSSYCPGLTLERKDVNGNYDPQNCIWDTRINQARNKRNNKLETYNNETLSTAILSEKYGIPQKTLLRRLYDGWDIKRAIEEPIYERRMNTKYKNR